MEIKIPFIFDQSDCNHKVERNLERILTNTLTLVSLQALTEKYQTLYDHEQYHQFENYKRDISRLESCLSQLDINKIQQVNNSIFNLNKDWVQCSNNFNKYGIKLDVLLVVSRNIKALKENIITEVHSRIDELKESMGSDFEGHIITNYKYVRFLNILKASMKEHSVDNSLFISEVELVSKEFFKKFWAYFDDILDLAKHNPGLLVTMLRLIEEDEEYSDDLRKSFGFNSNSGWTNRHMSLKNKLYELLEQKAHAEAKAIFTNLKDLHELLEATIQLSIRLYNINESVTICFPPDYNIFELYKSIYLQAICNRIIPIMRDDNLKSNLPEFAKWLDRIEHVFTKMGLRIEETELKEVII
jgi:hypothetical protein